MEHEGSKIAEKQTQPQVNIKPLSYRAEEEGADGKLDSASNSNGNGKEAVVREKRHLGVTEEFSNNPGKGINKDRRLNVPQAIKYHEVDDKESEGRAYGNLGSIYDGRAILN